MPVLPFYLTLTILAKAISGDRPAVPTTLSRSLAAERWQQ
jgi:hypothetical protein